MNRVYCRTEINSSIRSGNMKKNYSPIIWSSKPIYQYYIFCIYKTKDKLLSISFDLFLHVHYILPNWTFISNFLKILKLSLLDPKKVEDKCNMTMNARMDNSALKRWTIALESSNITAVELETVIWSIAKYYLWSNNLTYTWNLKWVS